MAVFDRVASTLPLRLMLFDKGLDRLDRLVTVRVGARVGAILGLGVGGWGLGVRVTVRQGLGVRVGGWGTVGGWGRVWAWVGVGLGGEGYVVRVDQLVVVRVGEEVGEELLHISRTLDPENLGGRS